MWSETIMPAVNLKLENKILSTFAEMVSMKMGEEITLNMKDESITFRRVK